MQLFGYYKIIMYLCAVITKQGYDNYLDELSKLYKLRDKMENEKPSATEETK